MLTMLFFFCRCMKEAVRHGATDAATCMCLEASPISVLPLGYSPLAWLVEIFILHLLTVKFSTSVKMAASESVEKREDGGRAEQPAAPDISLPSEVPCTSNSFSSSTIAKRIGAKQASHILGRGPLSLPPAHVARLYDYITCGTHFHWVHEACVFICDIPYSGLVFEDGTIPPLWGALTD